MTAIPLDQREAVPLPTEQRTYARRALGFRLEHLCVELEWCRLRALEIGSTDLAEALEGAARDVRDVARSEVAR